MIKSKELFINRFGSLTVYYGWETKPYLTDSLASAIMYPKQSELIFFLPIKNKPSKQSKLNNE